MSICAAIVVSAFFGILLLRRWMLEGREAADRAKLGAITRSYLQRVGGYDQDHPDTTWSVDLRTSAVSHLHLLLRGGERQRLMQLAELDGLLETTIRQSRDLRAARRIDAIRSLQQFGSEACVARLRRMLTRDRHPQVKLEAAFALASLEALPPPRELLRILGMFARKPNRLDSALLRSAAPQYADHLMRMLGDPMPHWRRAFIIDALGYANDPTVLPTLRRAASMDEPELRSAALRAATKIGNPSVAEWVEPMLDDPVAFVRIQAANCCALLGLQSAVPKLQEHLTDDDLWVRLRSGHALDVLVSHWPSDESFGAVA
jgi:HEAT repeat protein